MRLVVNPIPVDIPMENIEPAIHRMVGVKTVDIKQFLTIIIGFWLRYIYMVRFNYSTLST
jgi:hypothetical protein